MIVRVSHKFSLRLGERREVREGSVERVSRKSRGRVSSEKMEEQTTTQEHLYREEGGGEGGGTCYCVAAVGA
jgi:hypothetical protein